MWILYQTVIALALAVAGPILLLRRGRHYLATLAGRLGAYRGEPISGPLWLHAVSVGEARVAATLIDALPAAWRVLVTTVTPTGQHQAASLLGERAATAYLPFDLGFAVGRFLRRFEPRALIIVEGDYWPLVLRRARRRGLPIVVVNGRMSERTFGRLRRVRRLARLLLGAVDRFAVQTTDDRERLARLGVDVDRITVTGNMKFDAPVPAALPGIEERLVAIGGGRPILVAGSTMSGEEGKVLRAFDEAGGGGAALLVLAPRHPERWDEVASEVRRSGSKLIRRSTLIADGPAADGPADVVLLDSLGELAAVYRIATAAFVGGTLVATGGHNPLEPAAHGVPVAVGPSMHNFRQMAEAFDEAKAWQRVDDADALAAFFLRALRDPDSLRALGTRGRELVDANRGARQRTLAAILPHLREEME